MTIVLVMICLMLVSIVMFVQIMHRRVYNSMHVEEWADSCGQIHRDLSYGKSERHKYDLFVPSNVQWCADSTASLILFVHGGGWIGGDKEDIEYMCQRYAKQGYLTATMNYTLLNPEQPQFIILDMVEEMRQCITAICTQACSGGYPLGRMAVGGYSAGGGLAMLYACTQHDKSPLPVAFAIIEAGAVDLNSIFPEEKGGKADTLRMCSAITYIDSLSPPAIFAYGAEDLSIRAEKMVEQYEKLGIPYTFISYPNSGHEMGGDHDCAVRFNQTITDYAQRYFK